MTGALLDLQRVVAADGHPGEAGAAQVVEAQALAGGVVAEERGAVDSCGFEVLAQVGGPPFLLAHRDHLTGAISFAMDRPEKRHEVRLDGKAADAFVAGLRLLHLASIAIPGDADGDDAALDVDVAPVKRLQLARANEEVDAERVEPARLERHDRARDEA